MHKIYYNIFMNNIQTQSIKLCNKCLQYISITNFNKRGNKLQSYCRDCNKISGKIWYKKVTENRTIKNINLKTCSICKIEQPINNFYKNGKKYYRANCKTCECLKKQELYSKFTDEDKAKKNKNSRSWYANNRNSILKRLNIINRTRYKNDKKYRELRTQYRITRKMYYQEYGKSYYIKNKIKINKRIGIISNIRYKTDVNFKILKILRSRFRIAIKSKNDIKSKQTLEILGCSLEEFKKYLELKFKKGMSWENNTLKGWHMDHIKPCSSFDLTDPKQQQECFHYTNIQPLWWYENLEKHCKIL